MSRRSARIRAGLRQRRYHRAFRIAPPTWEDDVRDRLDQLVVDVQAATRPATDRRQPADLDEQALADAATNLWRARRKLAGDGERPSGTARAAGRYLRTCDEALTDAGLVVQDHDGDAFHPGRSLEVLLFQDDPTLSAETVMETVRPSIYLRDRRIQMGQVIVGRPMRAFAAGESGRTALNEDPGDQPGETSNGEG